MRSIVGQFRRWCSASSVDRPEPVYSSLLAEGACLFRVIARIYGELNLELFARLTRRSLRRIALMMIMIAMRSPVVGSQGRGGRLPLALERAGAGWVVTFLG